MAIAIVILYDLDRFMDLYNNLQTKAVYIVNDQAGH